MKLIWSPEALRDLTEIRAYIAKDNPAAAAKVVRRIVSLVSAQLPANSESGRVGRLPDTRELVISHTPFMVPYRLRSDTVEILREEMDEGPYSGLIHCFSTSRQLAENCVAMGLYISLSGIITFRRSEDLRDTVRALPPERLLVETDAPYLAPVPKRGKRNEPSYVVHTAQLVAGLKGMSSGDFARLTTENFLRLFTKARVPKAALA